MATYKVLIVDDQREMRSVLLDAVQTLGPEFFVVAVPSGEEALLELRGQSFDLLVSDVLLPGMTGLELMEKAKSRNPELKIILITGVIDRKIRRDVADAGANAFFLKPIDTADFLDSIERCLGLVETFSPVESGLLEDLKPTENVSDRLTGLRKELDAISTVLLDDSGHILAQAGDLPDDSVESTLFPSLMASFSASSKISRFLGSNPPNDLSYFSGPKYDLFFAHAGEACALLVFQNPVPLEEDISEFIRTVYSGVGDLQAILQSMGVKVKSDDQPLPEETDFDEEDDIEEDAEEAPILDALFETVSSKVPKSEDVNAFWDALAEGEAPSNAPSGGALTYDQAVQLGLAPDDEEEGEED